MKIKLIPIIAKIKILCHEPQTKPVYMEQITQAENFSSNLFDTHLMSWPGQQQQRHYHHQLPIHWDKLNNCKDLRTQLSQIKPHELVFLFMFDLFIMIMKYYITQINYEAIWMKPAKAISCFNHTNLPSPSGTNIQSKCLPCQKLLYETSTLIHNYHVKV